MARIQFSNGISIRVSEPKEALYVAAGASNWVPVNDEDSGRLIFVNLANADVIDD